MYILVVDDDQFANTLVHFVLSKEGYEVETVDSARGAMQMIQRREPDLLLLDHLAARHPRHPRVQVAHQGP